jgi:competence protein ComEC
MEARGLLFPWVPVLLGCGIGLWFALPWEPGLTFYGGALAALAASVAGRVWGGELSHPLWVACGCLAAGLLACGLRVQVVAAPMLETGYRGPVMGRVVEIDRAQSDALRLTLDRVVLEGFAPEQTPYSVRISVRGEAPQVAPGEVVMVSADLLPPPGPAEPGGFDFRRMAFFDRLGAVGYTANPVVLWDSPAPGEQYVNRLRSRLGAAIMQAAPGDAGAFAAGAMTGDRSGIGRGVTEDLRDSNLSHLLAISGMNMAFLTGFVFMTVRYGAALVPPLALRVNAKKLAAGVAFGVALFYLLLSGANVATERAFLMVTVMLGAVLADRRALTLRTLALSGTALLLWQPESLTEPGFQLSFAATAALIGGFGALDRRIRRGKLPRWLLPVYTLVLSSVLAGAATAPFAAAHFNRFTDFGLIANLLTVPVMSVVMGAGAVAALLAPLGLAAPAIWVMAQAARWILFVAHEVAALDGAVTAVPTPGPAVLPLVALAGTWALLWRGPLRWGAAPLMLAALILWASVDRPVLLVAGDGAIAGVTGPEGRALSKPRGGGFAAESWLENDGDLAEQAGAAARPGFDGPLAARRFVVAGLSAVILSGKSAAAALPAACAGADLVIVPVVAEGNPPGRCTVIDAALLARTGALAGEAGPQGLWLRPTHRAARAWEPGPVADPVLVPYPAGGGAPEAAATGAMPSP